jgi:hypothetical protein
LPGRTQRLYFKSEPGRVAMRVKYCAAMVSWYSGKAL